MHGLRRGGHPVRSGTHIHPCLAATSGASLQLGLSSAQGFWFPPLGGLVILQKLPFHVIVLIKSDASVLSLACCFGARELLP